MTVTGKPRLTKHQTEVLGRLERSYGRLSHPVPESYLGCVGALFHLAAKGYAHVARVEYGPRGGEFRSWAPGEKP